MGETIRLLVFGDAHIKPTGIAIDYDRLTVSDDIDVVVLLGDVVHDVRDDALACGREFIDHLTATGTPVVAVPGNHDPLEHYPDLIGDVPNAIIAHDCIITGSELGVDIGQASFVGWGYAGVDRKQELQPTTFPELCPDGVEGKRYAADMCARDIEDALFRHVTGQRDKSDLVEILDIRDGNRARFLNQADGTKATFERLSVLIERAPDPTVVLSHVPPYNLEADRHHSIGERTDDIESLHVGSIGLKLALRAHDAFAVLHGHSHNPQYELVDESVHSLNLGFRGIATVTVTGEESGFTFNRLAVEE